MKKNFFRLSMMACLLSFLTACGTTGAVNLSQLKEPIPTNKARIIVTRDSSFLYMAAAADIRVNGTKIASLGRGGSIVYEIPKGRNTLTVTTLGSFGQYTTIVNAAPKKTYEFVVSPRSEALGTSAAFGLIGDAVSASNNDKSGYFEIKAKDSEE